MTLFFGIFMGYIFFSYFSDNFGRRRAMIMTWMTSLVGIMILCSSKSLEVASLGLFLAGAGCESNLRVNLTIINEIVDYHLRQVYSVILQSAFGVAGISIAVAYNLLYDWRIVTIFFCAIPAFIVMVIIFVSLEETPGHLSAQGSKKVLLSLQRIAAINGLECNITEEEVLIAMTVRIENDKIKASGRQLTLFDLFHYKSLRKKTLYLSLMLFFLASLYIGPNSVLETFKVDIFWLQVILSLPDCIVYPLTCHFIVNIERRKAGLKYLGLASVFLFLSIFFKSPEGCDFCIENIIKLTLLFFSRCCVSFYYGVLFVYII
jgi:MFS family permease